MGRNRRVFAARDSLKALLFGRREVDLKQVKLGLILEVFHPNLAGNLGTLLAVVAACDQIPENS